MKKKKKTQSTFKMPNISPFTYNHSRGITLVALVVTIVVLLILAGITVTMLFGENGIIKKAKEASNSMNEAQKNDLEAIDELNNWIGNYTGGNTHGEAVTNPYDPDGWIMAWTCTNGTWSSAITSGNTAQGDIVAKLYSAGSKVTPKGFNFNGRNITFTEGDAYKLVIEGTGKMPELIDSSFQGYAWQELTPAYVGGASEDVIMPYVTEVIVCDGIESIGTYAFAGSSALQKITLGNDIKKIESFAFVYSEINKITIPKNVTIIGEQAFVECTKLEEVQILTTNSSEFEVGQFAFDGLKQDSVIYVTDRYIKAKLDKTAYDILRTETQIMENGNSLGKKIYEGNLTLAVNGKTQVAGLKEEMTPEKNYRLNLTINGKERTIDLKTDLLSFFDHYVSSLGVAYTKIEDELYVVIIQVIENQVSTYVQGSSMEIVVKSIYDVGKAENYIEENGFGIIYNSQSNYTKETWGLCKTPETEYIVPETVAGKSVERVWMDAISGTPTFTKPFEVCIWDVAPNVSNIKITTSDVGFYFNALHIDSWLNEINVDLSECEGDITLPDEILENYRGTIYVTPEVKAKYESYENIVAKE